MKLKKTKITKNEWNLCLGDEIVGKVEANYKTPTQRFWSGHVTVLSDNGPVTVGSENMTSAKKVMDDITYQLKDVTIITRASFDNKNPLAEKVHRGELPPMADLTYKGLHKTPKTSSNIKL